MRVGEEPSTAMTSGGSPARRRLPIRLTLQSISTELTSLTARPAAPANDNTDTHYLTLKIGRGLFATIALDFVLDGLSLVERTQPGPLNGRDVDEHINPIKEHTVPEGDWIAFLRGRQFSRGEAVLTKQLWRSH
jgi:hypothetical protein